MVIFKCLCTIQKDQEKEKNIFIMLRRFRETIKNCRTTEVIVDVLCFNSNFKPKTMFEIIYVPAISAHLLFLVIIKTLFGSSYFGNLDIQPHRYGFDVNLREKRGLQIIIKKNVRWFTPTQSAPII